MGHDYESLEERRKRRLYRTLVRIERVDGDFMEVMLPAWSGKRFNVHKDWLRGELDIDVLRDMPMPVRVFAKATLGVENHEEMRFLQWEPETIIDSMRCAEIAGEMLGRFAMGDINFLAIDKSLDKVKDE